MNLLPIAKILGVNPGSLRGIYMKYYPDEEVDMMMEGDLLWSGTIPVRPLILMKGYLSATFSNR